MLEVEGSCEGAVNGLLSADGLLVQSEAGATNLDCEKIGGGWSVCLFRRCRWVGGFWEGGRRGVEWQLIVDGLAVLLSLVENPRRIVCISMASPWSGSDVRWHLRVALPRRRCQERRLRQRKGRPWQRRRRAARRQLMHLVLYYDYSPAVTAV